MKNRLLLFGYYLLFSGFFCLLFSVAAIAAHPDNNTPDQTSDARMHQIRSHQNSGMIHPADVLAARQQLEQMSLKSSASLGLNWMPVGPTNYAGRCRVVLFDNQDPDGLTIYTGGVTGGIYKSTNKGLTWNPLNIGSTEILRVSAITQTPGGIIYVGTGEYYCGTGPFMGTGLYRSDDGMNFTSIPSTKPTFNDTLSNWAYVRKLACDPNGRLFAATNTAILYSDNGETWTTLMNGLAVDVVTGSDRTVMYTVDGHVYIAAGGDLGNIVDVSTGEENMLPVDNVGWIDLAIAPSDPNILYASIARAFDFRLLGVYRSGDNGATWSVIFPGNPTYDPLNGNGCYANTLQVFPDNPNRVLLGSMSAWLGEKYQETGYYDWQQVSFGIFSPNGSFASSFHHDYSFRPNSPVEFAIATDNGVALGKYSPEGFTYQTSNRNLVTAQFNSVAMTCIDQWIMGGGIRVGTELFNAVPMNTPQDGYVPPTSFRTGTFCQWSQLKPDYIFFSGTNFGSSEPYVRSEDLGESAALSFLESISSTLTQYLPSALWETDDFPYSIDTVWLYARNGPIEADSTVIIQSMNCYQCPFEYTVPVTIPQGDSMAVLDPFHSRFFIYGTELGVSGVYMTQDAIKFYKIPEWFRIGRTVNDILTCMAVSSDLNTLWAGTKNGKLYRFSNLTLALDSLTANEGSSYCIVSQNIFEYPAMAGRYITNVAVDPMNDDNVLVTLGNYGNMNYVYLTQNALDSLPDFTSVQGNLPYMPVYDALFERHGSGTVILGTDFGVFSTGNIFAGTPAWSQDLTGMGDIPVTDLTQQRWEDFRVKNLGYIAAASYGRGLFYDTTFFTPLGIPPVSGTQDALYSIQIHPNPVKNSAYITYTLPETMQVTAHIYDLTGRLMTSVYLGSHLRGTHTSLLETGSLPNGTYIIRVNQGYGKMVKMN